MEISFDDVNPILGAVSAIISIASAFIWEKNRRLKKELDEDRLEVGKLKGQLKEAVSIYKKSEALCLHHISKEKKTYQYIRGVVEGELCDGNTILAHNALTQWMKKEASSIAEFYAFMTKQWLTHLDLENETSVLNEAKLFIGIALKLDPKNPEINRLSSFIGIGQISHNKQTGNEDFALDWNEIVTRNISNIQQNQNIINDSGIRNFSENKFEIAFKLFFLAWYRSKELSGDFDRTTLTIQKNLASCLSRLGKITESNELLLDTFEKQKNALGENDRDTMKTNAARFIALGNCGKFLEAAALGKEILVQQEFHLDPSDEDSIHTRHELAWFYGRIPSYVTEGEKLYRKNIGLVEKLFPKKPARELELKIYLAKCLVESYLPEKMLEAKKLLEEIENDVRTVFGETHKTSLLYRETKLQTIPISHILERIKSNKQLLEMREQKFPDNIDNFLCKYNLASLYYVQEEYIEAEKLFKETFKDQVKFIGRFSHFTMKTKIQIVFVLSIRCKFEEAIEIYEEILIEITGKSPTHDLLQVELHRGLSGNLIKQEQYESSLAVSKKGNSISGLLLGERHVETIHLQGNMIESFINLNRIHEAKSLCVSIFKIQAEDTKPIKIEILSIKHQLTRILDKQDKFNELIILYREILDQEKAVFGIHGTETLSTQNKLGNLLSKLQTHDEGIALLEETLKIRMEDLGSEHEDTIQSQCDLESAVREKDNPSKEA